MRVFTYRLERTNYGYIQWILGTEFDLRNVFTPDHSVDCEKSVSRT
jgi:hypothetical protein